MNIHSLFLAAALLSTISACSINSLSSKAPTGQLTSDTVAVTDFTAISAAQGIKVSYTQAPTTLAVIDAPADILPYVKVEVVNHVLRCSIDHNSPYHTNGRVAVTVTSPMVSAFSASSSGSISVREPLNAASQIDIKASSSGAVSISDASCRQMSVSASSSAAVSISATADAADINASSSAAIAAALQAKSVNVNASSSAAIALKGSADYVSYHSSSSASLAAQDLTAQNGDAVASSSGSIQSHIVKANISTSSSGTVYNH